MEKGNQFHVMSILADGPIMLNGGDAMMKSHTRTYCTVVLLNAFAELCLLITTCFKGKNTDAVLWNRPHFNANGLD